MAWRGINLLSHGKGKTQQIIKICPRVGNLYRPTWVNTTSFDKNDDGITKAWSKLQKDPGCLKSALKEMKGVFIDCDRPVDTFKSNGEIINIQELYGVKELVRCIFMYPITKDGKKEHKGSLLVVGNKTAKEIEACGYNKKKESYSPLLFIVRDGKSIILNSI